MGKKPSMPTYSTKEATAEQNRLNQAAGLQKYSNVSSPLGSYAVTVDPNTGKMTVDKVLSDNSMSALNQQYNTLSNFTYDPAVAEQAYYDAQMAYLQPQMQRQVMRAESGLTNNGIPLGSRAWNELTGDVYDAQNQTLGNLSNSALSAGQQYQAGILGNAQQLGAQVIDPTTYAGANGAGLSNTYDKLYQNKVDIYKTKMADYNSLQSALFPNIGSILGIGAGAAASGNGGTTTTTNAGQITDIYGNVIGQKGGYGTFQGN